MKPNFTDITVVLDRSGSMESIKHDVMGGFNSFVEEQRKLPGECRLSLYQFDEKFEGVEYATPIGEVQPLMLFPRGMTALYDAVGRAINLTGERLAKMKDRERPSTVIFVIITDGQENSSREFNRGKIAQMIKEQRDKYNWQFLFMGANQDAVLTAQALNIPKGSSLTYSADAIGTQCSYGAVTRAVSQMRAGELNSLGEYFTPQDRAAANQK